MKTSVQVAGVWSIFRADSRHIQIKTNTTAIPTCLMKCVSFLGGGECNHFSLCVCVKLLKVLPL